MGWQDSNLRMPEPKPGVLPLDDTPMEGGDPDRFEGLSGSPKDGGGGRDRTDDILRARQTLSQLSYTPVNLHIA